MLDWKPGDEVVCVDDSCVHSVNGVAERLLTMGAVYTLEAVGPMGDLAPFLRFHMVDPSKICVFLREVPYPDPHTPYFLFPTRYFRKTVKGASEEFARWVREAEKELQDA